MTELGAHARASIAAMFAVVAVPLVGACGLAGCTTYKVAPSDGGADSGLHDSSAVESGASGGAGGSGAGGGGGGMAGASGTGGSPDAGSGVDASGCAPACNSTQACVGTRCLLVDGQTCTLTSQCASSACTPFYADADGDSFGAGPATGFCGTTTPVGYAAQSGDCCDNSAYAVARLIHPNAGFQTSSANGVCGVTWDYDCDGMIESSKENGKCSANSVFPNNCVDVFHYYPESACGTTQSTYTCIGYISSCTEYPSPDSGPLGCR